MEIVKELMIRKDKKRFTLCMQQYVVLTAGALYGRMYINFVKELQQMAQTQSIRSFPMINEEDIDQDYNHIVDVHVHHENPEVPKQVFLFFHQALHHQDGLAVIQKCISLQRLESRWEPNDEQKYADRTIVNDDANANADFIFPPEQIWRSSQEYKQGQLDKIHCHLAHELQDFKRRRRRRAHNAILEDDEQQTLNRKKRNELFVEEDGFGFGVAHEYHTLSPKYSCIYQEVTKNKNTEVEYHSFRSMLAQIIRTMPKAQRLYKCTRFDAKYNMVTHEPIGIRHVVALNLYTDFSKCCTEFRKAFRRENQHENHSVVLKRIEHFYWFGRCLFEAVEFFGREMNKNKAVYHGLNLLLQFHKFHGQFHHPLSTTTSFSVAQQFSDGGIIVELMRVSNTKLLRVAWFSAYPNEEENLLYGKNVTLRISDIRQQATNKSNTVEISMLDKFQCLLENQTIAFNASMELRALTVLWKHEMRLQSEWDLIHGYIKHKCECTAHDVKTQLSEQQKNICKYMSKNNDVSKKVKFLEYAKILKLVCQYHDDEVSRYFSHCFRDLIVGFMEDSGHGCQQQNGIGFMCEEQKILDVIFDFVPPAMVQKSFIHFSGYGRKLFHYFCCHPERTSIHVQLDSMPEQLRKLMFTRTGSMRSQFSFIPALQAFPFLQELHFHELKISSMESEVVQIYVSALVEYDNGVNSMDARFLREVSFSSERNVRKLDMKHVQLQLWQVDHQYDEGSRRNHVKFVNQHERQKGKVEKLHQRKKIALAAELKTDKQELEQSMITADKKSKYRIKNEIFDLYEYYKPIRLIGTGRGAFTVVCEAIDERTKKRVAIKKHKHIFDDIRDAQRILREIKLLLHFNKYKHPDLIEIYDSLPPTVAEIQDFEDVFIVMPLLDSDLCKVIASKQKLTNLHYQYVTYQILRGLKFIHESGVIHRDIKPENILLNGNDCDVKITDFRLARGVLGREGAKATEYVTTRWYRSPEVMCSGGRYDEKMDIWGVGCILAEMILRRPLFPGANYLDQLRQIFDVMGTPKSVDWILNDEARRWVQKLPKQNGKSLKKMIADKFDDDEDLDNCTDLLYKLLALNPVDRISASDPLPHPYFKEMHADNEIPSADKFDLSFEFEQSIRTKFGVRHMIYTALDQHHKKVWYKIKKLQRKKEQREREKRKKEKAGKDGRHSKHRSSKHGGDKDKEKDGKHNKHREKGQ